MRAGIEREEEAERTQEHEDREQRRRENEAEMARQQILRAQLEAEEREQTASR